jgi:hypothetical protein
MARELMVKCVSSNPRSVRSRFPVLIVMNPTYENEMVVVGTD